jgi:hypothetical protein
MKKVSYNWWMFDKAREYIRNLRLKSFSEWLEWAKSEERPSNIPANPSVIYKHRGWVDIGDWLETGRIAYCRRKRSVLGVYTQVESMI